MMVWSRLGSITLGTAVGVFAFLLGLFLPLWLMAFAGKTPGNAAGTLILVWVGFPLGLVCGLTAGIWSFLKSKSRADRAR